MLRKIYLVIMCDVIMQFFNWCNKMNGWIRSCYANMTFTRLTCMDFESWINYEDSSMQKVNMFYCFVNCIWNPLSCYNAENQISPLFRPIWAGSLKTLAFPKTIISSSEEICLDSRFLLVWTPKIVVGFVLFCGALVF